MENQKLTKEDILYLYKNDFNLAIAGIATIEDEALLLELIEAEPDIYRYLPLQYRTDKIQKLVIKCKPDLISLIHDPSKDVRMFIAENNPDLMKFVATKPQLRHKSKLSEDLELVELYKKNLSHEEFGALIKAKPSLLLAMKKKEIPKYVDIDIIYNNPLVRYVYYIKYGIKYTEEFENEIAKSYSNLTDKLNSDSLMFKYDSSYYIYIKNNIQDITKVPNLYHKRLDVLMTAINIDPTVISKINCLHASKVSTNIFDAQRLAIDKSIFNILYMDNIRSNIKDYAIKKIAEIDKESLSTEEQNQLVIIEKILHA